MTVAPDTFTPIFGFRLQATGSHINDWINQFNTTSLAIDAILAGAIQVAAYPSTDKVNGFPPVIISLSVAQSLFGTIEITDANTPPNQWTQSSCTIKVPILPRVWLVNNKVTDVDAQVRFGSTGGPSVILRSGVQLVYIDSGFQPHLR